MINRFIIVLRSTIVSCGSDNGSSRLVVRLDKAPPENGAIVLYALEEGQMVAITAEIYNSGIRSTHSVSSIVTVGFFVDDELIHIGTLDNILPGIKNKIQISSPPLWTSEIGVHDVKVILDYHDTLLD